jgi:hypothetical protein
LRCFDRFEKMLDGEKCTADVYGVCFFPEGEREVPEGVGGAFVGDAGVGGKDVYGAEVGYCSGDGRGDVGLGANVTADAE